MLIALTGGIAAGKSTVAAVWQSLGAIHIDADELAREVVAPETTGLKAVVSRFGSTILNSDGSLNRQSLGDIVFRDATARLRLESILHPLIQQKAQQLVAEAGDHHVVYSIPLFVETQSPLQFDKVVTVSASEEVRCQRLIDSRGLTKDEALGRIRAQASDEQREAVADVVINSDCSIEELRNRATKVWQELTGSK